MGTLNWNAKGRVVYLALNTFLSLLTFVSPFLSLAALTTERAMRSTFASRIRSKSISAVPPPQSSSDYSQDLASIARRILYRSPLPSKAGHTIYILNAAAFPDTREVDYDAVLPYVLARLPEEDELLGGTEYEVVFFAGGGEGAAAKKSGRPSWAWFIQAYNVLSRAMRKRIQRLYIVHEKSWVRVLVEMFSTVVSPKFRKKVVHVSTLSALALHLPIQDLLIPSSAYLYDRRLSPNIHVPYVTGRRAFSARHPLPKSMDGQTRLPRVLRETTRFILLPENIKQEGIFRIPPHAKLNEVLREAYDRGQRFIIWKEGNEALPLTKAQTGIDAEKIVTEVDQVDAYGVAAATGLIKSWYRELRQPLFPRSCYPELRRLLGDRTADVELSDLITITSPNIEVSPLPSISRTILTRHLLPLLAQVDSYKDNNQMTAQNLAICFAPTTLCGPDQLEDMKMSSLVSRYLEAAIASWNLELRKACGIERDAFGQDLEDPKNVHEYEDPLDLQHSESGDQVKEDESQTNGIVLLDKEIGDAPPLPPRRVLSEQPNAIDYSQDAAVRRRPTPAVEIPPRYSTLIQDESAAVEGSPISYVRVADGFAPQPPNASVNPFSDSANFPLMEKSVGGSSVEPCFTMPKRKAVPTDKPSNTFTSSQSSSGSYANTISRKPLVPPKSVSLQSSSEQAQTAPPIVTAPPNSLTSPNPDATSTVPSGAGPIFAKPTWPASSTRSASLPSANPSQLPVVPIRKPSPQASNVPVSPASTSTSSTPSMLPPSLPKPRTPSPSLMQRMPSFEASKPQKSNTEPMIGLGVSLKERMGSVKGDSDRLQPKRLEMRERSVDDLRRIYEERMGTVQGLVRTGSEKEREVPSTAKV